MIAIPRRVAAQAAVAGFALTTFAAFLLHWPCRNSGYTDSRFTAMCYSDLASWLSAPPLSTGGGPFGGAEPLQLPPVAAVFAWLGAQVPGGFGVQIVWLQLILAACLLVTGVALFRVRPTRPLDPMLALLLPLWPFAMFVAHDLLSVAFASVALMAWQRQRLALAAIAAGTALAAGAWTWLLLMVFFVDAYRSERSRVAVAVVAGSMGVALAWNLPRLLAGQPLLLPTDWHPGEGTPLFVIGLLSGHELSTGLWVWFAGVLGVLAIAWWAARTQFDFRPESLLLLLVAVQLITALGIQPQSLTHLLWLLPWVRPSRNWLIAVCVPLIVYVAAVWLRFEAGLPDGKGATPEVYSFIAAVMWVTLLLIARTAWRYVHVQGIDEVAQSYARS